MNTPNCFYWSLPLLFIRSKCAPLLLGFQLRHKKLAWQSVFFKVSMWNYYFSINVTDNFIQDTLLAGQKAFPWTKMKHSSLCKIRAFCPIMFLKTQVLESLPATANPEILSGFASSHSASYVTFYWYLLTPVFLRKL